MSQFISEKSTKMGPIIIVTYYSVNSIDREYKWTHKDCPEMRTVGYKGLRANNSQMYKIFAAHKV